MDEQKQRILIAVMALNFTVIALMLVMGIMAPPGDGTWGAFGVRALISGGVGIVVAAIAYFVAPMISS